MTFRRTNKEVVTLPARAVLVAAGTSPNIIYEKERPGTFALDDQKRFFRPFRVERSEGTVGLQPDVATRTTVAAVGSALGRVRLLAERHAARAAVAAADVQLRFVDEVRHVSMFRPLG